MQWTGINTTWALNIKYNTKNVYEKIKTYTLIDLGPASSVLSVPGIFIGIVGVGDTREGEERVSTNTEQESWVGGAEVRWVTRDPITRHQTRGPGVWAWSQDSNAEYLHRLQQSGNKCTIKPLYRICLSEISCSTFRFRVVGFSDNITGGLLPSNTIMMEKNARGGF